MNTIGVGLMVLAALVAAGGVRLYGEAPRATRLWWLAGLLALPAATVAYLGAVPVPAALAAGGLVGAAVVDGAEHRIPRQLATGTAVVSLIALAVRAIVADEWWDLVSATLLTAGLAAGFAVLWQLKQMGLGDVRLVPALVTGLTGGWPGLLVLLYGTFLVGGVVAVFRRLVLRRRGDVPFGPALLLGWLAALTLA